MNSFFEMSFWWPVVEPRRLMSAKCVLDCWSSCG